MKELRDAILKQGFDIGHDIVKVDMFLNHRLDIALLTNIGQAFHEAFADEPVDMILTDCMGFTREMGELVSARSGKRVFVPRVILPAMLGALTV